eukprot:gnl/TRDRNA2_/TRDRNA2_189708_c0_seq1.p2 gnl/TRDRNA2_/TRDRNA2_189708_c0~~gnl/TRDRNA2_/TRDRNA2_189708_c0_seq1.p2  ORF type:complete len:130 (-),score=45.19 gnl/TRDRNA2_/TRDRNA2_189708_c0_seq1:81-470(-)
MSGATADDDLAEADKVADGEAGRQKEDVPGDDDGADGGDEVKIEEKLDKIITDVKAPDRLRQFLISEKLHTIELLFASVQDINEVDDKIASKLDPPATDEVELKNLRFLWRRVFMEFQKLMQARRKMVK